MEKDLILKNYEDIKKEIREKSNDIIQYICDYNNGYICDIITEIADNNIDIYTYDLLEWLKNNYEIVEEANNEFGTPNDIIKQIQQAQYYKNSNELYEDLKNMILLYTYNYLYDKEILLNDEDLQQLEEELQQLDNNNRLEEIETIINNIVDNKEEKGNE